MEITEKIDVNNLLTAKTKSLFDELSNKYKFEILRVTFPNVESERWLKAGVVQTDGNFSPTLAGTPQGGVISPLLANLFLHVVFDKWMDKHHPEKPFERYADDIVVHCKTENQAKFMMRQIKERMESCKLQLHEIKSKIVNLRGFSQTKYPKGFDF